MNFKPLGPATWILLLAILPLTVAGQSVDVRKAHYNLRKGIAMDGYDPVSYFSGRPVEGSDQWKFTHQGVSYLFSSKGNLEAFKSNPEKYEPAYGGWCAYAMGENGEKVKIDPETYKILNGRLYLFYNFWGNNTLKSWNKNEGGLKKAGDNKWNTIVHN